MGFSEEKSSGFVVAHHHHQSHESNAPPAPPPPDASSPPPPPYYGTFQGIPTYPPPVGFPQPAPPSAASDPRYYSHAYQSVPGYAADHDVAEGRPVREPSLPCCGLGLGWFLFIIGFFLAGIPWYIGAVFLICTRSLVDAREKAGYVLCTIGAILVTIAMVFGATRKDDHW